MQLNDKKVWEPLKTQGFHFCHLNVNSLLSKIDELKDIKNYVKAAILGSRESKRDSPVTNAKVNIKGYGMIMNEKNTNFGGVTCYIRNDLCFNTKNIFSNQEYFFKFC